MNKITSLFDSRRFWVALVDALIVAFGEQLGLSQDVIAELSKIAIAWIIGDSLWKTGVANGLLQSSA